MSSPVPLACTGYRRPVLGCQSHAGYSRLKLSTASSDCRGILPTVATPSAKQILRQLLDELPDDATIADVQYRLYIIDAVNRGRDEIVSGAGIPHARVASELRAKWGRANET